MTRPTIRSVALALGVFALWATPARAADPATDFKQNCASCHTIGGGRLTGPDLKHVEKRKDRDWLLRFIQDPGAVLDSGDPYAQKLLREARGVRMPNVAGMSRQRAEDLLDLIAQESKLEKSRFAGVQVPMRPFTPEDVRRGRRLFTGREALAGGGASCIACHDVGGLGLFGGGTLGPDLTKVFERYETRKKLGAWLSAPATPTMQPTFREHPLDMETEIMPLVAYFEHAARHEHEGQGGPGMLFFLLALGGTALLLALAGRVWRWRFRAVRRPLLRRSSWAGRRALSFRNEGAE